MRIYQVVEFGHTLRDTAPRSHAVAAICAFERFDAMSQIDVKPTSQSWPWAPQLGGERAYKGHFGKDRNPRHSRHSIARTK